MKKVCAIVVLSLFVMNSVYADTPTNKAIGYDGGLSLRMIMASGIGIQGIVGFGMMMPVNDNSDTDLDLNIGGNVFKCLWENDDANLNMFAGVGIVLDGTTTKDGDSNTDINIMLGLEPEVFLSDNLSVSAKMGARLSIAGDRRGITDTGWTDISTFGNLLGAAALHWYF